MLDKVSSNIFINPESKNIVRSLFGVISAVLVAILWDIAMPQVAAIFAIMLLTKGSKPLGIKNSLAAIASVFIFGLLGLFLGDLIMDYPLEIILVLCLIVFWSFRLVMIPETLRTMFLTFSLMFPFLSLTGKPVVYFVFADMLINLVVALVMTQLAFIFFPDTTIKEEKPKEEKQGNIKYNMDKVALNGLIMLMPFSLYFFYFTLNTFLVSFIYVIILGLDPLIYKSKYPYYVIIANFLGGAFAIIAYNLLTMSPSFLFYMIIITAAGLFFTYNVFSTKKTATLIYPLAYRAFFLILSVIFTSNDTAEDNLSTRLLALVIAIAYVVFAYQFLNFVNNPIIDEKETKIVEKKLKPTSL